MDDIYQIRVMVVDDQDLIRTGISAMLDEYDGVEFVGKASSKLEAISLYEALRPDVVLMDIKMEGPRDGIETTREIVNYDHEAKILALTNYDDPFLIQHMLSAGAIGFVTKAVSNDNLIAAIRNVYNGLAVFSPDVLINVVNRAHDIELTMREHDVIDLTQNGLSNEEIAKRLNIKKKTVEAHMSTIMNKLNVHNRTDAVNRYRKWTNQKRG